MRMTCEPIYDVWDIWSINISELTTRDKSNISCLPKPRIFSSLSTTQNAPLGCLVGSTHRLIMKKYYYSTLYFPSIFI